MTTISSARLWVMLEDLFNKDANGAHVDEVLKAHSEWLWIHEAVKPLLAPAA